MNTSFSSALCWRLPLFLSLVLPGCGAGAGVAGEDDGVEPVAQVAAPVVIPVGSTEITAELGQGYDLAKETFLGHCIKSDVTLQSGQPSSRISLERSITREEMESDLGIQADAKARYGAWSGSASGKFQKASQSDGYSTSLIYSASYTLPNRGLDASTLRLTPVGQSALENLTWPETCGDEAVTQVRVGGRFYLSFRIDFSSKEVKDEFNLKVNVNAPFGSMRAQVNSNKHAFVGKAKVHVEVLQIGGDVTQITRVISGVNGAGSENTRAFVQCDLTNLEACETFIVNALDYAANADVPTAFPSQLQSQPADIAYVTQPWITLGVQQPPDIITQQLKDARQRLQTFFDEQSKLRTRVERILDNRFATGTRETELLQWRDTHFPQHFAQVALTVKACYDEINHRNVSTAVAVCEQKLGALLQLPKPSAQLLDVYGTEEFILKKWASLSGPDSWLGEPISGYTEWTNGGIYRRYRGGAIFWHPQHGAFPVRGAILDAVLQTSDPAQPGFMGYPRGDEVSLGDGGVSQTFSSGTVVTNPHRGTFAIPTAIYNRLQALGGVRGSWGYPSGPARQGADNSILQEFPRGGSPGAIHVLPNGTFETTDGFHATWQRNSPGAPISNAQFVNNVWVQRFMTGTIIHRNNQFITMLHGIEQKWRQFGGEWNGTHGWPLSDRDSRACQNFERGVICQVFLSAYEMHGSILARWRSSGGLDGILSYPVTDELTTSDGVGRYNEFLGDGAIVHHPNLGSYLVPAQYYDLWRGSGGVHSCLGYPRSEVRSVNPSRGNKYKQMDFERGYIRFTIVNGVQRPGVVKCN